MATPGSDDDNVAVADRVPARGQVPALAGGGLLQDLHQDPRAVHVLRHQLPWRPAHAAVQWLLRGQPHQPHRCRRSERQHLLLFGRIPGVASFGENVLDFYQFPKKIRGNIGTIKGLLRMLTVLPVMGIMCLFPTIFYVYCVVCYNVWFFSCLSSIWYRNV